MWIGQAKEITSKAVKWKETESGVVKRKRENLEQSSGQRQPLERLG